MKHNILIASEKGEGYNSGSAYYHASKDNEERIFLLATQERLVIEKAEAVDKVLYL